MELVGGADGPRSASGFVRTNGTRCKGIVGGAYIGGSVLRKWRAGTYRLFALRASPYSTRAAR